MGENPQIVYPGEVIGGSISEKTVMGTIINFRADITIQHGETVEEGLKRLNLLLNNGLIQALNTHRKVNKV